MIWKPRKTTIGLCLFLQKNLEAKKKKWKQADKKKNENGWICIEEKIMMLVDDNCL